ncbi:hypothetical protein ACFQS2_05950 [Brachybacterium sp. GCM10030267]|uniref:hypothetical protein n=1 Tax=Brachybacterium sp. GCM10030267 TaxID=3273381 RepID=UPI0036221176
MSTLLLGLGVALVGALLLAAGVELQSRAVHATDGQWRSYLTSRGWLLGAGLLAAAVMTNLLALALAPVSAVQAVNIIALAASSAVGALTGRIVLTRSVVVSILACVAGVLGVVGVLSSHPGEALGSDLDSRLPDVITIQAVFALAAGALAWLARGTHSRRAHLAGLVVAAMLFASITTVVKVLVELVLRDGLAAMLVAPGTLVALVSIAVGAGLANVHLQRAHRTSPAPVVVAGSTITDTITAAAIGILVLGESALTPSAAVWLLLFAAVSAAGVLGLSRLRRTDEAETERPRPALREMAPWGRSQHTARSTTGSVHVASPAHREPRLRRRRRGEGRRGVPASPRRTDPRRGGLRVFRRHADGRSADLVRPGAVP